jgi:DNA-binding CsgD family transcriptional regulator
MMRRIFGLIMLSAACGIIQVHAQKTIQNRSGIILDSLKSQYNGARKDVDKARIAVEILGLVLGDNMAENKSDWLKIADQYAKKSGDRQCIGYVCVYRSYMLPTGMKARKYQLLDSADGIFDPEDIDGRAFMGYVRVNYGIAYGNFNDAGQSLKILENLFENHKKNPFFQAYMYFQVKARLEWHLKNYKESLDDYKRTLEGIEKDAGYHSGKSPIRFGFAAYVNPASFAAGTCNNIGLCYLKLDSLSKAITYFKRSIPQFRADNNHSGIAWTYQLIGECFQQIGSYRQAEPWLQDAIREIENQPINSSDDMVSGDLLDCIYMLNETGTELQHYDTLIHMLDSAHAYIDTHCKTFRNYNNALGFVLLNKADAYAFKGQNVDAERCADHAAGLIHGRTKDDTSSKKIRDLAEANSIHEYMARAFLANRSGKISSYTILRDRSLQALNQIKDSSRQYKVYKIIARYLVRLKDYPALISWHTRFYRQLGSKQHIIDRRRISEDLSTAYASMNRFDSAYKYSKIFSTLNDSVLNRQNIYAIQDLSEKYKSESEKLALERQNEQLSRSANENIYRFLGGAFILSLITVILFLNRQRLANRHQYEKTQKEKLKLELAQQQKELSDAALEIVRSNNAYESLMQDIEHIGKTVKGDNRRQLKQLIISQKMHSQEDSWRQFNMQFEKMNSGFYDAILEIEPSLTDSEKKICALMALGLSNKEISAVTFQSIKSIYTYKNRLRKKFGSDSDEILSERLSKLLSN